MRMKCKRGLTQHRLRYPLILVFSVLGLVFSAWSKGYAQSPATTFVVSVDGDDQSAGSATEPWRSIAFALSQSLSGDTIWLEAGAYTEVGRLDIPCGVNLMGAGSGVVNIASDSPVTMALQDCVRSENVQRVGGFILGGIPHTIDQGLVVNRVRGVTIFDIVAADFLDSAVVLDHLVDSEVHNLVLQNSGKIFGDSGCGGTLTVGSLSRTKIHDLTIDGGDAYGIKGTTLDEAYPIVVDSEFYNMTVDVTAGRCSLWDNFAWEMFQVTFINTRIHHNIIGDVFSLPELQTPHDPESLRIDHNHFDLCGGGAYALELDRSHVELDHNLFTCGGYAIASFGGHTHSQLRIHHNVFVNQNSVSNVMHIIGSVTDSFFDNNTVISNNGARMIYVGDNLGNLSTTNLRARNNLFVNTLMGVDTAAELGELAHMDSNLFWGMTPYGDNPVTQDPLLPLGDPALLGGAHSLAPYIPAENSVAIGAGVIIARRTDATPDIGAIDSDQGGWTVGP